MTANEIAQMVRTEPYHTNLNRNVIADFIDQQADRIAELEKVIQDGIKVFGEIQNQRLKDKFETPQTKPLSDEEIRYLVPWQVWRELPMEIKIGLVRAIEAKVRGEK